MNRHGQSLSGQVIDGFEIGPCLAQGGAAFLYECIHADHDKPLLMKVPRLGINQPVAGLIGFETECLVQPRLDMMYTPKVHGVGALDEQPYMVMEAVPGRTLENLIATRGPMPLEDLIEIGAAIARALHAIHRAQVIHLDVKPANMILHPDGHIVLLDFGFAHHAQCPILGSRPPAPARSPPWASRPANCRQGRSSRPAERTGRASARAHRRGPLPRTRRGRDFLESLSSRHQASWKLITFVWPRGPAVVP